MSCGFHRCERLCHSDACGTCTAPCGKSRKSWWVRSRLQICRFSYRVFFFSFPSTPNTHPCTLPCHAPSVCQETEPCRAPITLTCPCGRVKQVVNCGRTISNPTRSTQLEPKCTNECHIAKRNAVLAEALGIDTEAREKAKMVVYGEGLLNFAKSNGKFLNLVEKTFAEWVAFVFSPLPF